MIGLINELSESGFLWVYCLTEYEFVVCIYFRVYWYGIFIMDCGFFFLCRLYCDLIIKGKID